MLYPSDGEFSNGDMSIYDSLTTGRHSKRKEGVGSGERALMLVLLPLDCVGEVFSWMVCYVLQIETGARVNGGNVE